MKDTKLPSGYAIEDLFSLRPGTIFQAFLQQPKSFWFACGYLFFEYVRPQSVYPQIDFIPWPTLFLGLTLVWLIIDRQTQKDSSGIGTGLVLMSVVVLLSSATAENPGLSVSKWPAFFNWIIIFFLIRQSVNNEIKLFLFIVLFFLANIKMTQHGFLSWAGRGFTFADWGVTGAPGWFQNSGEFGIQLCIFLPMLVGVTATLWKQWSRTVRFVIIGVMITGISSAVATSSRGALMGLGAAGIWMSIRSKYFVRVSVLICLIAGAVYLSIPAESMSRFRVMGTDTTSLHRIERWRHGWQAMQQNPLFGVGFKNWESYYARHFRPEIPGPAMVHNIFVEAGTELGFTGLGAFAWLIYVSYRATRRVRAIADKEKDRFLIGLSYGLDASTVGLLVSASFVTVFYYPYFWIQCLLVSCLCSATAEKYAPKVPVTARSR